MDEVDDQYTPADVETAIETYWDDTNAYEATKEAHADDPSFFFVDGPPYTSGQMHLGTAWNKTLKDAIIRYKRMTGHHVTDRPGYDMHGLPIEVKVEEELGFETKRDIEEYGMESFIEECKRFAVDNRKAMDEDFQSIGVWMDWDNPYETLSPEYMEAAWWAFQQVDDRGLVERGKRSVSYCPRCQTAIAANEVEYDEITSPSIYVRFPLSNKEGSLVIWTTTPWTIPANTFVAVDKDLTYQAVRAEQGDDSEVLYIAESCVEDVLKQGRYDDYTVVEEYSGDELTGWEYDHPLADQVQTYADFAGAGEVYTAEYVEADRTGLVHSAPGHGQEDFARGQELDLETFVPVDGRGEFTEAAGQYTGTFVRDANDEIINDLDEEGVLLSSGTHEHRYGHCWRCDTDIIFLATDQWFITVTDIKDELLDNINDSEWYPQWARDNRFRDFVADAPDWNVSRQRYWGIPLPIWESVDDADTGDNSTSDDWIVIGTREELAERADQDVNPAEIDLHRPAVDPLTITENGSRYERVPDVFDVWIDSSVASWGTIDYPGETDAYDELWPADFIVEAHDQTRGWFWSQLGMGTAATGQVPYEEVMMHGFANDENGRKMSKSRGNIVTPEEAIDRAGRDPLRAYLLSHDQQGVDLSFEWDGLGEMQSTLNIFWNVFRFPLPYMDLDGYDPATADLSEGSMNIVDEWVLSRLQSVKATTRAAWEEYEIDTAVNTILEFITDDVSRFYIKAIRERMWADEDSASKRGAYATLSTVLDETIRLLAPIAPYLTEQMYQHLNGSETTVHALSYPSVDPEWQNETLESEMAVLRDVEEAAANARQQGGRKLRWPVPRVIVEAEDDSIADAVESLSGLLADRVNTEAIETVTQFDELIERAQPEMSVIGPEFGADAQRVMDAIEGGSREILTEGVTIDGVQYEITDEMITFDAEPPAYISAADFDGGTVYVDTSLTESIEAEGYARDVIRRIQQMRKELALDVDTEIQTAVDVADDRVADLVAQQRDVVATETRTNAFVDNIDRASENGQALIEEWDVEGVTVTIGVAPLKAQLSDQS
ncbi:isoleucine--tRNA ligase [Haloquadratum walsbyi]|uniref:Isoleucine--tRNA ligase n=1 Tax=Haloquadratum walsbyi (strain DSM 16790 / HBSQ001) TaxID=362976 RepID=SYI_HALWD|nr:isoleucine--tRNA ligase [Haloquadratum walsbyi]Q18GW3.1 RecName: Full=Isoleucine--tRNA ligase; AltName: Full=Isoleucyl-tRNA synthetase; Short=IleRS [Haloquadratum walsbyi DSM 16790]CAJ52782.1 isoleucine--tRNA ligase [Haloquadratum walsbyi DSM 16790]